MPRPIELHAHDPLRYIGDMLAWVHQAIAAERELLESLFGLGGDGRMVGSIRVFDEDSEEEEWMRELMDACVGKLCTPLKVVFMAMHFFCWRAEPRNRSVCNRQFDPKRAASSRTKLQTSYNFT